jgi:hypothetical protein
MYINPRIPAIVNGKPVVLCFDAAAVVTLMKKYSMTLGDLQKIQLKNNPSNPAEDLELLMKLLFCMTRSNDEPLTEKDIERLTVDEIVHLKSAIERTFSAGTSRVEGEGKRPIAKAPGSKRSRGSGAARSSRRSTSAASRRRNSGD